MTTKLIGMSDATPGGYGGAAYQSICRFQAEATGTMTEFKVKCNSNGTISYAVYADSSGSPSARLAQQATPQNVVSDWNTLAISSVSLVSGTYYWLAVYVATGDIGYNVSGGTRKYKSGASTFTDPFDNTGFSNDSVPVYAAGWGVETTLKTSGDDGSGTESITVREIGAAESGSASEGALAEAAFLTGDGGIGSEIGGLLKSLSASDEGAGADALKVLTGKAGSDLRLRSHHGQVGIPHKEVSL